MEVQSVIKSTKWTLLVVAHFLFCLVAWCQLGCAPTHQLCHLQRGQTPGCLGTVSEEVNHIPQSSATQEKRCLVTCPHGSAHNWLYKWLPRLPVSIISVFTPAQLVRHLFPGNMAAVLIFGLWKQSSSHNGSNVGRIFQAVEEARQKCPAASASEWRTALW